MLILILSFALLGAQTDSTQSVSTLDLPGKLNMVDKPPSATPVEAMSVAVRSLDRGELVRAQPDQDGNFSLKGLRLGRFALELPFPGRIITFTIGRRALNPADFKLKRGEDGPLRIVVSLRTSEVNVDVRGLPSHGGTIIALLSPADSYLTLRDSSISNTVLGQHTQFRYVPPGNYWLFVVDSQYAKEIWSHARVRAALKDKAVLVKVRNDRESKIAATYLPAETILEAIRKLGSVL
ncbi:MAG: carboxypeptidase regulatory-like domain-containing protein [Acidobacteria bacterium]|nr:carboxypeptidase regulatory-like domain-containing protein [Acidobacteriota bacterium]